MLACKNIEGLQEEAQNFCKEIFSEILENILTTFEVLEQESKKKKPEVPKLLFQPKREPVFLSHFVEAYKLPILQTLHFNEKTAEKSYQLKQLEVHKQHVFNFCGYHTFYNLIEVCKLIKTQDLSINPKNLFNPAR